MSRQKQSLSRTLTRELALGSLLFFLPLLLLIVPRVGQAAGWQLTNLQGRAISQFAAAPAEGLVLYYAATSTNGLQRSSTNNSASGFEMWHEADAGLPGQSFWEVPAVRRLAINANNGRELIVLLAADHQSSLYHTSDGGAAWQLVRGNLDMDQAGAIALTPDGTMILANGNRLLWRASRDAGWIETPAWPAAAGTAHHIVVVDASFSMATARPTLRVLVVTTAGNLFMLDSIGGTSWQAQPVGSASRVDLVVPTVNGLYAATDRGIYHSADAGASWSHRGDLPATVAVQAMTGDPTDANALYVATAGGGVLASYDGGTTWVGIGRGLEKQNVHALVVDPRMPRQLLLATDDGVWRHALRTDE